jgi:hypothetical protein
VDSTEILVAMDWKMQRAIVSTPQKERQTILKFSRSKAWKVGSKFVVLKEGSLLVERLWWGYVGVWLWWKCWWWWWLKKQWWWQLLVPVGCTLFLH